MQHSRHLKIFISSTFNDMHNEREILLKNTFLELKKIAKSRDVEITEIDLRTGVTKEQAESGKIVKICLDEIERCADSPIFFLGILANRYGWSEWLTTVDKAVLKDNKYAWIEEHQDVSITEIEIISALERDNRHNKALFYFKEHKEDDDKRLIELKNRLIDKSKTDNNLSIEEYKHGEEFREKTIDSFKKVLDELFPEDEKLSEVEKLRASHQIFAKSRQKIYIPYEENETILSKFIDSEEDRLLLYGESGYGKSALIANYFEQFKKEKSHFVIEHYIGGAGELSNDLHQMLRRIMLEIKEEFTLDDELPTEPQKILDEFALWLHRVERPTIIVLDGYNQIEDELKEKLFYYLPEKFENVKLIITSIKDEYPLEYKQEIKALTENEQKELIEKYLKHYGKTLNSTTLQEIVSHPQTNNTLFLKTLLDEIRLLGTFEKLSDDIANYLTAKDVVELFSKIFERLERDYKSNLAKEVLSLLYVSRDGLSEDNLMEILNQNGTVTRLEFSPLFLAVEEHLVDRGGLYGFFHGFIEEAVKGRYLDDTELVNGYRRRIADYFEGREIDGQRVRELPFQLFELKDVEKLSHNLLNVDFFIKIANTNTNTNEFELSRYVEELSDDFINLLVDKILNNNYSNELIVRLASFFHVINPKYDKSLLLYQKVLKNRKKYSNHPKMGESYNSLANLYKSMGKYNESLKYFEKSLEIREEFWGAYNPLFLKNYSDLGQLYEKIGNYDKALSIYNKILEKSIDSDTCDISTIYNSIGRIYQIDSKYKKALEFYEKALIINKKILGTNHISTAQGYNNIGILYEYMGNYNQALSYINKSLEIKESIVSHNHLSLAAVYSNLAKIYNALGKLKKALKLYKKALNIYKINLGDTHDNTATVYDLIGGLYRELNEYEEALIFCRKALKIRESILGTRHKSTISSYSNLGVIYETIEKYDKAESLYTKALMLNIQILGENHLNTANVYYCLSNLYRRKGKYKISKSMNEKSLKTRLNLLDKEHPHIANNYSNLGLIYFSTERYEESEFFLKEALLIRKKKLGLNHYHTSESYFNLGALYYEMSLYKEALKCYQEALSISKNIFDEENLYMAKIYNELGIASYYLGQYRKAHIYMQKSILIREKKLSMNDSALMDSKESLIVIESKL